MGEAYARRILRNSVAQICQTIGYHSTQTTPHEVLEDVLHRFMQEFCRDLHHNTEHYNRTEANISDVELTLRNLNISIPELRDYINNVEPVPYPYDIPVFPAFKESNLNFLKPGSKEILIRPVHIYDYLPPIQPPSPISNDISTTSKEPENNTSKVSSQEDETSDGNNPVQEFTENVFAKGKNPFSLSALGICSYPKKRSVEQAWTPIGIQGATEEDTVRDVRELTSVFMTTGGFISPAVEGKVASSSIPEIIVKNQDPNSFAPAQLSSLSGDNDLNQLDSTKNNLDKYILITSADKPELPAGSSDNWNVNTNAKKDHSSLDITSPPKKHLATHTQSNLSPSQAPTVASKLLKKAKKKNLSSSIGSSGKFTKSDQYSPSETHGPGHTGPTMDDIGDKIQRKWIKKLQKLSKSKQIPNIAELFGPDGKIKATVGPSVLASIPPGPERQQLEKLLRKQAKQKQKLMKQQMGKEGKIKRGEQLFAPDNVINKKMIQPIPEQTVLEIDGIESGTNLKDSKLVASSKQSDVQPLSMSPTLFPFRESMHSHMIDSAQILRDTKHAQDHPIGDYKQNLTELTTKNNQAEVKLSTEPNRSKLNIFKKISKQKNLKSPNVPKLVPGTTIFDSDDVPPVINLPSGTTITPAPPTSSGQHVYSPDIQQENAGDIQNKGHLNLKEPSGLMPTTGSNLTVFNAVPPFEANMSLVNKPKKRGRKPGQKNNPKPVGLMDSIPVKKTKKIKLHHQNIYIPTDGVDVPSSISVEPLNLFNADYDGNRYDMTSHIATGGIPKSMVPNESMSLNINMNERKERKKTKAKNISTNISLDNSGQKALSGVPTKEEVNLINEKLLRMDTTMKPAVPVSQIAEYTKTSNDSSPSKSLNVSPTKSMTSPKTLSSKKRAQPKLPSPSIVPPPFMPQVSGGFPNLPGNIMPMIPIYPFQPRPGLIPAPGLFPAPGLGNFVSNPSNPASSMLLSRFMQFPNLKATGSTGLGKDNIEGDKLPPVPPPVGDRSYCNVAPLVPESMKLTPPDIMSPTKTKRDDRVGQKQLKSKQYPVFGELQIDDTSPRKQDESNKKRLSGEGKPSTSTSKSSTMTASESGNFHESLDDNNMLFGNPVYNAGTNKSGFMPRMPSHINVDLGSEDAPIELSDDSVDVALESAKALSPNKSKSKHSLHKSSTMSESEPLDDDNLYGKVKKIKKSNKSSKKHNLVEGDENPGIFDLLTSEKNSKLTKLIPSPAPNRLMDIEVTPGTSTFKKDGQLEKTTSEFDNITITSSSTGVATDLPKKRKEHKKLKKTKEGKIKKKKDKKDKTKSKERSEKYLLKAEQILKEKDFAKYKEIDFIKKLKKEKKKERQRYPINSSTFNIVSKPGFSPSTVIVTSTITATADSTVNFGSFGPMSNISVPKITLKLGERDKKELSPELARISPLITRPPKQKSHIVETPTNYGSSQTASSSSSSSGQSNAEYSSDGKMNAGYGPTMLNAKNLASPPNAWFPGGTIAASSVLLPQQLIQPARIKENILANTSGGSTTTAAISEDKSSTSKISSDKQNPQTNRPSSYIDAEGNRVWICPACGKVDDGSAMIGCDGCDAWYHWVCVGIFIAPKDNEDWFCRVCITRKKSAQGSEKKRKRTKKK